MHKLIVRYQRLSKELKAVVWFTICNIITRGISFISAPAFTRLLSTEEYGQLSLFNSYEQVIIIIGTWEIMQGAYQRGILRFKGRTEEFTSSLVLLANLFTMILFICIASFFGTYQRFSGMDASVTISLFIFCILRPAYTAWMTRMRFDYEYKKVVLVTLVFTVLNFVVPLLSLVYIDNTANVKFVSTTIGSSILFAIFYFSTIRITPVLKNRNETVEFWKYAIQFQLPLVLHSLSYLVLGQADRIMIGNMVGKTEAAFYSVAYSLASAVSILQSSLNQVLVPWRYKSLEKENYKEIRQVTNIVLILIGGLIFLFILVAPEFITLLFTHKYDEAIWSIPPVSVGVYFMFLYSTFVHIEQYYEKTKYVMYVSVFCGILNIVLNYILIRPFGYVVCGYTTLFSYVIFAIGHYYFMKKICKEKIGKVKVVDSKFIILLSSGMIASACIVPLLYRTIVPRYAILAIGIFILCINHKSIISTIKNIRNHR